jgi:hypothetical protein
VVVIVARSDSARLGRDLIAGQFDSTQILPYVAINKDAFPNRPAHTAGRIRSFRLPKQAQVFGFSSAISGFRSLCGRKQRSFKAIAPN